MTDTHSRFIATCEFCGKWLDTRKDDDYQLVEGWVERVGNDDVNLMQTINQDDIHLKQTINQWAHRRCVENAVRDLDCEQS
jgi:hypothetical protein